MTSLCCLGLCHGCPIQWVSPRHEQVDYVLSLNADLSLIHECAVLNVLEGLHRGELTQKNKDAYFLIASLGLLTPWILIAF